ncbi:MAG TPA: DsbA family protein [Candidatus Acidoferrales bacterium]|nr:DsbA family protein [Candidatus Acidoferrales bacterium]
MSRQLTRAQRRRVARDKQSRPASKRGGVSRTQLLVVGVVALLAVAAFIYIGSSGSRTPVATVPPGVAQNGQVLGQANAPVTIDEWADFQCPACGMYVRNTEPQIRSTYVANGQVKIVFHDFAFLGSESNWAAEAALCASDQGKFWEYHDKLYASQRGENQGAFTKDNLKKFGSDLGLGPAFAACVDSGKYAQSVRDEQKAGQDLGVNATPTLFVNGQKLDARVYSYDDMKKIIDPKLGK